MSRRPRLLLSGVPLHIIQRGHNRQQCFFSDSDFLVYLEWLRKHGTAIGCSTHAYVLMSNHVHILASFEEVMLAPEMMRRLAQQYTLYLNRRLGRTGSVWEGRFWSHPVPTERYFMKCHRYIEANPVRALMVDHQQRYRWSSYRGNAGFDKDRLLCPHELYRRLGLNETERIMNYRRLSDCELSAEELWEIRGLMNAPAPRGRPRNPPVER
ncbi:transposase [Massilia sp. METH4]|uniref:transposase n=1 Tax=Massilia sp. METH4 TaxID=3123041 RepID=UPI0030CD0811